MPAIILFSVEYFVLFIIWKCHLMELMCYVTFLWANPWKYVSKKCDKNASVSSLLIAEKVI